MAAPVNFSQAMKGLTNQLNSLKNKVGESRITHEDLTSIIASLSHDVNQMQTAVKQHRIIGPVEEDLSQSLFKTIIDLQKTPAYAQVIGTHLVTLSKIFDKIENVVSEATNEVKPVENDPLDAR